jgi:hypothetical protein
MGKPSCCCWENLPVCPVAEIRASVYRDEDGSIGGGVTPGMERPTVWEIDPVTAGAGGSTGVVGRGAWEQLEAESS